MTIIKCKMCGGDIQRNADQAYGTCDSCGSTMTFPKVSDEQRTNLFNRANHFRRQGEFDKAIAAYENILNQDNTDAEAHWGVVLSRFGIEYVEDPVSHERVPTCHRVQLLSILNDADYLAALEHAPDNYSRSLYEEEARRIAELQKDILALSAQEKPYDVFICYKETSDSGTRTPDSALAQDVYYQLTREGYKVFFSRITLEDKLGQQYEPYIFAALHSARVMVVIGTQAEYFNAVWVKNEWSRFLMLMKKDRNKLLIPCYRGMDPYDLPEALSMLQSLDMGKIGFIQDLVRGIKKILDIGKKNPTTEVATAPMEASTAPGVQSLLRRAQLFLEDGDFKSAAEYADRVLDIDPEHAPAYIVRLQADMQLRSEHELENAATSLERHGDYQKAVRFADEKLKSVYLGYNQRILNRLEEERKESIYQAANELYQNAEDHTGYLQAAQKYCSISGFKDADERALHSQAKAEEARLAELKREEEERAAEIRRAAERAVFLERNKRRAMITIPLILAAVGILLLVTQVIIPRVNYQKAVNLLSDKQYDQAAEAFKALGSYSDAQQAIYQKGTDLLEDKQYDQAAAAFEALGSYADSAEKAQQAIYQKGTDLLENKQYDQAAAAFRTLGSYVDSAEKAQQAIYQKGTDLLEDKQYDPAAEAFKALGSYADSMEKALQAIYQKGTDLLANKQYDQAAAAFEALGSYLDSTEKTQQAIYQKGTDLLANKQYDQAATAFEALGTFLDSADMVKECAYQKGKTLAEVGNYADACTILLQIEDYKDTASFIAGIAKFAPATVEFEHKWRVGNIIIYGAYEQDNNSANGKEAIQWLILAREGKKALLIAEPSLDAHPYNKAIIFDVTWEHCSLRAWLNDNFLNTAFTENEQKAILTVKVRNEDNPEYGTDGGRDTNDKVFLLSIAEVEKFFRSKKDRIARNTAYAKVQGAGTYDDAGWWWLRSPGNLNLTAEVNPDGSVSINGMPPHIRRSVRPALWIDLSSVIFTSETP